MAGIIFKCTHCEHSIASDDNLCGEVATCPECNEEVIVPIPGVEKERVYGDFKLKERLGSGASGEVWLAYQQSMDRNVALKILSPKLSADKNFIKRFIKEAKNSAKLIHSNIVTAFSAGHDKGIYYLAISYVNGETIDEKLKHDSVYDEKEALKVIKDIASALQYAWDEFKILHRDIKPANIIINKKGVPMLLDLGISKSVQEEDVALTLTGTVVGTPYYMSPEQAIADKNLDFRSDIYSLGTTLYHMLTGTVPFYASTAMAIIMKHINEKFESPRKYNPKVSSPCLKLIEIMMAKKREERQQSWNALIKDIDLVLGGKNPETPLPNAGSSVKSSATKKDKIRKKHYDIRKIAVIIALSIITVAIILTGLLIIFSDKKEATSTKINTEQVIPEEKSNEATTEENTGKEDKRVANTEEVSKSVMVTAPLSENSNPKAESSTVASSPAISGISKNTLDNTEETIATSSAPEGSFKYVADQLDYTKNTSIAVKKNWEKIDNKEFTWTGKVVNVKGGWFKAEVYVACADRMLYRGFNAILVTKEKEKAAEFKVGQQITFTGMVYSYKPRRNGLVIMYMTDVKFQYKQEKTEEE